jgi:hypothetical protein
VLAHPFGWFLSLGTFLDAMGAKEGSPEVKIRSHLMI